MVILEMRDSAYDAAFELLEEAKHSAKKTKLTLCELEDAMYDCYESSKAEETDYEREGDTELDLRYNRRNSYRHDHEDHDMYEDEDEPRYRRTSRRMRSMRRRRMG